MGVRLIREGQKQNPDIRRFSRPWMPADGQSLQTHVNPTFCGIWDVFDLLGQYKMGEDEMTDDIAIVVRIDKVTCAFNHP